MNVTSFKRAIMKQLIKMHKQKGWLRWVPPQCPPGLEFLLPPPDRSLISNSGPQKSMAPSCTLIILTYRWSPLAACPFSSSSSSPRGTNKTQGIISIKRMGGGCLGSPGNEKAEGGEHPAPFIHTCSLSVFQPLNPFNPNVQMNCASAAGTTNQQGKRRIPTHPCPASNLTQSIWFHKGDGKSWMRKMQEVSRHKAKVAQGSTATGWISVEMAMWTQNLLAPCKSLKAKRSLFWTKN